MEKIIATINKYIDELLEQRKKLNTNLNETYRVEIKKTIFCSLKNSLKNVDNMFLTGNYYKYKKEDLYKLFVDEEMKLIKNLEIENNLLISINICLSILNKKKICIR